DAGRQAIGQVGVGDEGLAEGGQIDQTVGDESVAHVWRDPDVRDQSAVEQRPIVLIHPSALQLLQWTAGKVGHRRHQEQVRYRIVVESADHVVARVQGVVGGLE